MITNESIRQLLYDCRCEINILIEEFRNCLDETRKTDIIKEVDFINSIIENIIIFSNRQ
jgi:hypothetical protein